IVNTASVQGFASQRLVAAYAASKGGVIALTRTMALDHAPDNIRVNCICPGSIDTPMVRQAAERFASDDPARAIAGWAAAHPVGRIGSPDEVAKAVLYLASPDASFVTGASLVIDGGLLANLM
ncbi:MAG: SDR family oxidoreductase, partial [Chloroflexi bacterium]|nr:SDR family oxidoreductase [Chloroflexota bacterium]